MERVSHHLTSLSTTVVSMADEYFAPWLKKQLARRDWIAADLARRLPASEGTVSHWLRGERIPKPISCDKIADVFGIPTAEVMRVAGHLHDEPQPTDDPERNKLRRMVDGILDEDIPVALRVLEPMYDVAIKRKMRRAANE